MLKNEMVPSSKNSSTPSLLLTKSMSAIAAATVPTRIQANLKVLEESNIIIIIRQGTKNKPPLK